MAIFKIFAILANSLVATPFPPPGATESKCYIDVNILSNSPNLHALAGTKLPIYASRTIIPIDFKKMLFPE